MIDNNTLAGNTTDGIPGSMVDVCLSVYPELGILWSRAYLEKHARMALVETAAFMVSQGITEGNEWDVIGEALRDDLAPRLADARAQAACKEKDARFWAVAGVVKEKFEAEYKIARGETRKALVVAYDAAIKEMRKAFEASEAQSQIDGKVGE